MSAQLENGHTRIANEILESLCKLKISNYESRFLYALFRKTYGFQKKEDFISLSQFSKLTGIEPQHIARAKKQLLEKRMIVLNKNKIGINTELPQWVVPEQVVPNKVTSSTSRGNQVVPHEVDTKETLTKETIQKKVAQTSKNSLTACTQKELEHIAETKGIDLDEVISLHENILLKIQDGIFQKKGYGKTVYFTLVNWINRDLKEINKRKKQKRKDAFNGIDVI